MQSQIDLEGDIDQASWFLYMDVGQQHLVKTALFLLEDAENMLHTEPFPDYADYSYCIFPAAKAFEGLLKNQALQFRRQLAYCFHQIQT